MMRWNLGAVKIQSLNQFQFGRVSYPETTRAGEEVVQRDSERAATRRLRVQRGYIGRMRGEREEERVTRQRRQHRER